MPWVKLDDGFFDNDKIVAAGKDARDLYLAGLCYCARQLTDGFIPEERLSRLAIEAGATDVKDAVRRLCTVIRGARFPLWEAVDGGYRVHDYHEYNPTREEVLEMREKRAEAGKLGGQRSGEVRREAKEAKHEANASAKPKQTPSKNEPHAHARTRIQEENASKGAAAPADKPAQPGEARKLTDHQRCFGAISREWGFPANDIEKGRYNQAAKNFLQAEVKPEEIGTFKRAYQTRWPEMECTPLAVAGNVGQLRTPMPGPSRAGPGLTPHERTLAAINRVLGGDDD